MSNILDSKFVFKNNIKLYHLISFIIEKASHNEMIDSFSSIDDEISISFKENINTIRNGSVVIYFKKKYFIKINYYNGIFIEINFKNNFNIKDDFIVNVNSSLFTYNYLIKCKLSINKNNEIIGKDPFIYNIKNLENIFFESKLNLLMYYFNNIYNNTNDSIILNIKHICTFLKHVNIDKITLPKKENVEKIINIILLISKNNLEIIYDGFHLKKINYNNLLLITFAHNMIIFKEISITKFKYIFHPGLYFLISYIENKNDIENFCNLVISKALMNRI